MTKMFRAYGFNYFEDGDQGYAAYVKSLHQAKDLIGAINDQANRPQHTLPFVSPLTLESGHVINDVAKYLEIGEDEVVPYPFVIAEPDGFANRQTVSHGFSLVTNDSSFSQRFDPVFEARTKNEAGEWQPWQAIVGRFVIVKATDARVGIQIQDMSDQDWTVFTQNFEFRYGGELDTGLFGDLGIIDATAKYPIRRNINRGTYQIEFDPEGNAEAPFEQRYADWEQFERRYHSEMFEAYNH